MRSGRVTPGGGKRAPFQREPRPQATGTWFVPATAEGFAILGALITSVLATAWLGDELATPVRIFLGAGYLALSYCLSRPA